MALLHASSALGVTSYRRPLISKKQDLLACLHALGFDKNLDKIYVVNLEGQGKKPYVSQIQNQEGEGSYHHQL
jgi:hypothetical protein